MVKQMTKEDVEEHFRGLPYFFDGYYKYNFKFSCFTTQLHLLCGWGGNADDIYLFEVINGVNGTFSRVDEWTWVSVIDLEGNVVFSYYN